MKKRLFLFATLAILTAFGVTAGAFAGTQPIEVKAEEPASSETAPAEENVPETNKNNWIEDKIIPIVSGFSVANLVGIAISIGSVFIKRRYDKKDENRSIAQDNRILELEAKVATLVSENEMAAAFQKDFLEQFQITLNDANAAMGTVTNYAKAITEQVAAQNIKIEHVEEMKESLDASCILVAKALALSDVAVKSGIAKDAQKLVSNLQGGNSDGRKG